jgi:hypothetical protein
LMMKEEIEEETVKYEKERKRRLNWIELRKRGRSARKRKEKQMLDETRRAAADEGYGRHKIKHLHPTFDYSVVYFLPCWVATGSSPLLPTLPPHTFSLLFSFHLDSSIPRHPHFLCVGSTWR